MAKRVASLLIFLQLALLTTLSAQTSAPDYEERMRKAGLVDIQSLDDEIEVALKYATDGQNKIRVLR